MIYSSEAYSEPFQTSKIEYFPKIVDGLTISTKHPILDIWHSSEHASDPCASRELAFVWTLMIFFFEELAFI